MRTLHQLSMCVRTSSSRSDVSASGTEEKERAAGRARSYAFRKKAECDSGQGRSLLRTPMCGPTLCSLLELQSLSLITHFVNTRLPFWRISGGEIQPGVHLCVHIDRSFLGNTYPRFIFEKKKKTLLSAFSFKQPPGWMTEERREGDQHPGQNSPLLWQRTSRDFGGTRLHGCFPTVGPGWLLQDRV